MKMVKIFPKQSHKINNNIHKKENKIEIHNSTEEGKFENGLPQKSLRVEKA